MSINYKAQTLQTSQINHQHTKIILVTGCAGFIGFHTTKSLLDRGDFVVGIDNINDYYDISIKEKNIKELMTYSNFEFIYDDIRTTNIINVVKPYKIIHLAAMAGVRQSILNPAIYNDVNICGFLNILQQAKKNNVELVVYASSSSVYGNAKKIPFCETDTLENIKSVYANTKKLNEHHAELYYKLFKLKSIGLRFFTVYGPRGRPDMAPYYFMNSIMNEKPINKYGDGNSLRDYTYIDTIVEGIISALDNKSELKCEIFNLGSSCPINLNNFIKLIEEITEKKAIINSMPQQNGDVDLTYASIEKAKKYLNYNPKVSLKEGLTKLYEYLHQLQNQPQNQAEKQQQN